uniref:Uncharacterized protein n=1 Tax=Anopheles farauti TaxID=69004 RepID=A0A182QDH7_9DIPT
MTGYLVCGPIPSANIGMVGQQPLDLVVPSLRVVVVSVVQAGQILGTHRRQLRGHFQPVPGDRCARWHEPSRADRCFGVRYAQILIDVLQPRLGVHNANEPAQNALLYGDIACVRRAVAWIVTLLLWLGGHRLWTRSSMRLPVLFRPCQERIARIVRRHRTNGLVAHRRTIVRHGERRVEITSIGGKKTGDLGFALGGGRQTEIVVLARVEYGFHLHPCDPHRKC